MSPLDADVTGTFSKMGLAWDSLVDARLQRLAEFSRKVSETLSRVADDELTKGWLRRIKPLGYERSEILTALCRAGMWAVPSEDVFAPFVGHWVGGDLHDASLAYHQIVFPMQAQVDFAAQELIAWVPSTKEMREAYNFCRVGEDDLEISGVMAAKARVGYCLPGGALIWVAERGPDRFSLTVEKVWANDQLYDKRSVIIGSNSQAVGVDDWRYHRVEPHAIQTPQSPKIAT